jgi:hypothetical protein
MHADTIYVRAFEDRMDLLRVAMVGAAGTPYHDGLFFFDMQLPPSYPAVPPLVHYHSFGQTEKSAHMSARSAYLDGYVSLEIRADPTFAWSFIFVY